MNSSGIDYKYICQLSTRLDKFTVKDRNHFNCRCPICGDSKSNKSKKRGHFLEKTNGYIYHCFNCGVSVSFQNFLKSYDSFLYSEYLKELLAEKYSDKTYKKPASIVKPPSAPVFIQTEQLNSLKKVIDLDDDHPIKAYIMKRKIPLKYWNKLYFCPKFKEWTNSLIPNKYPDTSMDEMRLIIPLIDESGNMIGYQGRSMKKNDPVKYITIMINKESNRIFGMDDITPNKRIYAFEGPIDSFFITNSIASCGGDIVATLNKSPIPKDSVTIVYDNEPRSPDTKKKLDKAINAGFSVCIWPEWINEKDVNDMVLAGVSVEQIKKTIDENTFHGMAAKLKLSDRSYIH